MFLDGVGLGPPDPAVNPLVAARTPTLDGLLGGRPSREAAPRSGPELVFRPLDATLAHPGLPQSATGQATLLTGRNGAELMRGHYGPWPGPTLKRLLDEGTLFGDAPAGAALANAYPPGYHEALAGRRLRENVPVYAARSAGLRLRDLDDLRGGAAVAADLTGAFFAAVGGPAALAPEEAGARLAALAGRASFTFFDFWLSDRLGHRGGLDEAVDLVERLDRFLAGVLAALDGTTLLLTSDHGNLEDLRVRTHTRAAVPLLALGPGAAAFALADALADVPAAVRALWTAGTGSNSSPP